VAHHTECGSIGRGGSRGTPRFCPIGCDCRCCGFDQSCGLSGCAYRGCSAGAGRLGRYVDISAEKPSPRKHDHDRHLRSGSTACSPACRLPVRWISPGFARWGTWAFAIILTLAALVNFLSLSPWERFLLAPTALLLAALSLIVAIKGTDTVNTS
jgi:hypothetical protein